MTSTYALFLLSLLGTSLFSRGSLCSRMSIPFGRDMRHIYLLGSASKDTIQVSAGKVDASEGEGHSGTGRQRPLFGQIIRVERVGRTWSTLLPRTTSEVVLVPWDYGPDCRPVYWGRSAQWADAGTRGVFSATIRDRHDWTDDRPTLDVFAPEFTPYPSAYGYQRDLSFARDDSTLRDRLLSAEQFLDLIDVLPLSDTGEVQADSAIAPLLRWSEANPALALRWPAIEILRIQRVIAEDESVRRRPSPVAGTFRVTVTFGSGDSTVLYARTERQPMSMIRGRGQDVLARTPPIEGYYLMAHYAASVAELRMDYKGQYTSYHAVSLVPILTTKDSTVWRGEVDPLVVVTFLDPRAAVRLRARSLYGASEENRDSTWYFLPGFWVTYADGRARYEWKVGPRSQPLYVVRAERISTITTTGHSR